MSTRPSAGRHVGAAFLYLGIYLGVQFAVSTAYVIVLAFILTLRTGAIGTGALIEAVTANATLLSGISNLLSLMVLWILFSTRKFHICEEIGLRPVNVFSLLIMIPLGLSCYVLVSGLMSLLPQEVLESYADSSSSLLNVSGPLPVICLVAIAPFTEEVFFRGLIYTRLKRALGLLPALLIAGAVFGLLHGQIVWMGYAFVLSLLLTAVSEWYDSLLAGILLHVTFNCGQYVIPLLGDLGVKTAIAAAFLLTVPLILLARRIGLSQRR